MTDDTKGCLRWLAVLALAVALWGGYHVYSSRQEERTERRRVEDKEKNEALLAPARQKLALICREFGAIPDCQSSLSKAKPDSPLYTVDLQNALGLSTGKPVLLVGALLDVGRGKGGYILVLRAGLRDGRAVTLLLKAKPAVVGKLLLDRSALDEATNVPERFTIDDVFDSWGLCDDPDPSEAERLLVIARVFTVQKVVFSVTPESDYFGYDENRDIAFYGYEGGQRVDLRLDVNYDRSMFVVRGECLKLIRVEDLFPSATPRVED